MRKEYLIPATQEQSMTMCQLMAGSGGTPRMGINDNPLNGGGEDGIFYGSQD